MMPKLFACMAMQKKGMPVDRPQVNLIIAADGDTCIEVLQTIYNFIQGPAYE